MKTLILLFLALCFLINGCAKVEVYNADFYSNASPYFLKYPSVKPNFIVCSEVFAEEIDIDYQANLVCAEEKKAAKFVKKTYFSSCYLLLPVASTYECT